MLRRTKAGPFALDQAISLDKLNAIGHGAPLEAALLPLEAGLADIPALVLTPDQVMAVRQGRRLIGLSLDDGLYWAKDALCVPIALITLNAGEARVVRGFTLS